jgi:predicted nucleotidyltransferase
MNSISQEALGIVHKYCAEAKIVGIMLTGSYATGTQKVESDVDIILVSELSNKQTHENIIENGRMYQLVTLPYRRLPGILYDDLRFQKWVLASMFAKGVILQDDRGILQKIKEYSYSWQLPVRQEHNTLILRRLITHEFESLRGYKDETAGVCTIAEILRNTARLITGMYGVKGNHLDRSMEMYKEETKSLKQAVDGYVQTKDIDLFSRRIEQIIEPFGGFLDRTTTHYVFVTPNPEFMLVYIPTCSMEQTFVRHVALSVMKTCSDCDCYPFYEAQGQQLEKGVYVLIHSKTIEMTEVCARLEKLSQNILYECLKQDVHLSFPYQSSFYDGRYFGGSEPFEKLLPMFIRLSRLSWGIYYQKDELKRQQNFRLTLALKILYHMCRSLFEDNNSRTAYLDNMLSVYLPMVVDINSVYNINQLARTKEELLRLYDAQYEKEKVSITDLLSTERADNRIFTKELRELCDEIALLIKGNEVDDFVSIGLYTNKTCALYFHVIDHILSIFYLSSQEKFALIHKLLNCSKEYAVW